MSKRKKKRRKTKNRNLGPLRKRMRRPARLLAAATWRPRKPDKGIVRSYAKWFGVDPMCAITELRLVGFEVTDEHEQQVRLAIAARAKANARRRAEKLAIKAEQRAANRRLAANTPPLVIDWWDEWPWGCSPADQHWGCSESSGLTGWVLADDTWADAMAIGLVWIPTDDEAVALASIESEWGPTEEDDIGAAMLGLGWISTEEDDAAWPPVRIPRAEPSAAASIGPAWIPTEDEAAALAPVGPVVWIPTDEEDVALELIGPVEWLLTDEEYAALPWIRLSEWLPTDEEYAALPWIRPSEWTPADEEYATLPRKADRRAPHRRGRRHRDELPF